MLINYGPVACYTVAEAGLKLVFSNASAAPYPVIFDVCIEILSRTIIKTNYSTTPQTLNTQQDGWNTYKRSKTPLDWIIPS